jgi:ATP-dependent exoDNAse (exonuclease V) beta subunit
VAAYLKQVDPEERVISMNETFAVPVGDSDRPLIGEIDCVVEHAKARFLVDWKSSARRWPKDQADRACSRPATCTRTASYTRPRPRGSGSTWW